MVIIPTGTAQLQIHLTTFLYAVRMRVHSVISQLSPAAAAAVRGRHGRRLTTKKDVWKSFWYVSGLCWKPRPSTWLTSNNVGRGGGYFLEKILSLEKERKFTNHLGLDSLKYRHFSLYSWCLATIPETFDQTSRIQLWHIFLFQRVHLKCMMWHVYVHKWLSTSGIAVRKIRNIRVGTF